MFRACITLTAGILRYPRRPAAITLRISIIGVTNFYVLLGYGLGDNWKQVLQSWLNQPMVYISLMITVLFLSVYGWFRRQAPKTKTGDNSRPRVADQ